MISARGAPGEKPFATIAEIAPVLKKPGRTFRMLKT
jgi:hypothetical protein